MRMNLGGCAEGGNEALPERIRMNSDKTKNAKNTNVENHDASVDRVHQSATAQKKDRWLENHPAIDKLNGAVHYALGSNDNGEWCMILATSSSKSIADESFEPICVDSADGENLTESNPCAKRKFTPINDSSSTVPSVVHCSNSSDFSDMHSWVVMDSIASANVGKAVKPNGKVSSNFRRKKFGRSPSRNHIASCAAQFNEWWDPDCLTRKASTKVPLHNFMKHEATCRLVQKYSSPVEAMETLSKNSNTTYDFVHLNDGSFSCISHPDASSAAALIRGGRVVQSSLISLERRVVASGELHVATNGFAVSCRNGLLRIPLRYLKQQVMNSYPSEAITALSVFTGFFRRKKSLPIRLVDGVSDVGYKSGDWVVVFSPDIIVSCRPSALKDMMQKWEGGMAHIDISACKFVQGAFKHLGRSMKPADFYLRNPTSGAVLDVDGDDYADGAKVQLRSRNNSASQRWTYCNGNLIHPHSGKALEAAWVKEAREEGTESAVHLCHVYGTESQRWIFTRDGCLLNPLANKALCASDGGKGANIHLSHENRALTWEIVPWKITPV